MARGGVNDGADAALAHYARESSTRVVAEHGWATTVARFRSAPARHAPDDACAVSVVEDVAAWRGIGPVWRIDWCPRDPRTAAAAPRPPWRPAADGAQRGADQRWV